MGLPQAFAEIDKKLAECTDEVALACKYLYAFMPYSDIGNYAFEVFLDYAENGVYLWKENSRVAELPEEIDKRRAEEAKFRAEEELRQKRSIREYYQSKANLSRAMERIKVKNRHEI